MRYIIFCLIFLTGCACFRPAQIEDVTEIKTVYVPVPRPAAQVARDVVLDDTVHIATPELDVRLIRLSEDADGKTQIRVEAECKADTVMMPVPVPHRTVTNTVERKVMVWWGWLVIGGLLMLLILSGIRR